MRRWVFMLCLLLSSCGPVPKEGVDLQVVDGDTIKPRGQNIRLLGFDTPETFRPRCAKEKALGQQATRNLERLLNTADKTGIIFERKRDGGFKLDKYQRLMARLYINDIDVAEYQIRAGLARAYGGGQRRSWCG